MELPELLRIEDLRHLPDPPLRLSDAVVGRIRANRQYLESLIAGGGTYYGINTGFGSLCDVRIPAGDLEALQENLVCSHACGMGREVPSEIVRLMLLLKIHGLGQGYSGVRPALVQRLADFYNHDIIPVVYELGSLGASGDLAPLAHLSLPIFGKGEVYCKGVRMPAMQALQQCGLQPIPLAAKEGLALLNGTQFMSGYGVWALLQIADLLDWAEAIAALSGDAFGIRDDPFHPAVHRVRLHPGQIAAAAGMRRWLDGSPLQARPKTQVQDPYSFRCVPQVHGASRDAAEMAKTVMEREINAVTDNPIVFHDEGRIISGGNFHGQPLALQLDFLAIATAELGNISERRTYLLVSGQRGLPAFLAKDAGLHSGFMIAQYTAAAIVSQSKQYCTPASVDSIVSSNGQEDHVSMGANAATKLRQVVDNTRRVLAIELLTAAQALEFRRPEQTSPRLEQLAAALRARIPFMDKDRVLHDDLVEAEAMLQKPVSAYVHG